MTVELWLKQYRRNEAATSLGVAVLALISGLLVLFLTFWFTYAIVWVGNNGISAVSELIADKRLRLGHDGRLWISGVFVALLFVGNARSTREETSAYPKRKYERFVSDSGLGGGLIMLLAYPGASSKMITDLLYTGPRLITGAIEFSGRAWRLLKLRVPECAFVLDRLARTDGSVSNEELAVTLPGVHLLALSEQLREVKGVVLLDLGISVTEELRDELRRTGGSPCRLNEPPMPHATL